MKTERHLISVHTSVGLVAHAYLVTKNRANIERAFNAMCDELEKRKIRFLPIVLDTLLEDGYTVVEKVIQDTCDPNDADRILRSKSNTRLLVWLMKEDEPENQKLMDLH